MPAHVVEVAGEIHVARVAAAGLLRAADVCASRMRTVGVSTADRRSESLQPDIQPRVDEEPAPQRAHLLRAESVVLILGDERALGLVVSADALVLVHECVHG